MMRKAYYGSSALIILGFHTAMFIADIIGFFPYTRTLFFLMFSLLPMLMGIIGWLEKDRLKWPSITATLVSGAMIIYWLSALVFRLTQL